MNIEFEARHSIDVNRYDYEYVERKGRGHPDTLADMIAETASHKYSKYCVDKFGRVANHWFDKVMLMGGQADIDYGKGQIIEPYRVIFAGKISNAVGNEVIPVQAILEMAVDEVLVNNLTNYCSPQHRVIINELVDHRGAGRDGSRYQPVSVKDLSDHTDIGSLVSNDCNLISSYAPLSILEQIVLFVEEEINSNKFKERHKYIGWDVKVFGSRRKSIVEIVVNIPFIASAIENHSQYAELKDEIDNELERAVNTRFEGQVVELIINPQDRTGPPFMTALGSAADTGDVGVVGRGNRINGLITPMRPMSIEAPCGKNPIDHTGKIHAKLCSLIAFEIYNELHTTVQVHIFTMKGDVLNSPHQILIVTEHPVNKKDRRYIVEITKKYLSKVEEIVASFFNTLQIMC